MRNIQELVDASMQQGVEKNKALSEIEHN